MRCVIYSLLACGIGLGGVGSASAAFITDPAGDFLTSYTGPRGGDLDVLNAEVTLLQSSFRFTTQLNGTVGTTAGAFYVWGVDRGQGTARFFTSLGLTGVLFDSVLIVRPDGTGQFNDIVGGAPVFTLAPGSVTISGDTISAVIPVTALASRGLTPAQYTWNLWPRLPGGNPNIPQLISDFAPDNSNAPVTAVPEPASLITLMLGGFTAALGLRRRLLTGSNLA